MLRVMTETEVCFTSLLYRSDRAAATVGESDFFHIVISLENQLFLSFNTKAKWLVCVNLIDDITGIITQYPSERLAEWNLRLLKSSAELTQVLRLFLFSFPSLLQINLVPLQEHLCVIHFCLLSPLRVRTFVAEVHLLCHMRHRWS